MAVFEPPTNGSVIDCSLDQPLNVPPAIVVIELGNQLTVVMLVFVAREIVFAKRLVPLLTFLRFGQFSKAVLSIEVTPAGIVTLER